ncbi:vitamin-D-receptor interacting mediator subunit 4-domain-containing protein [Blyttiomyces helicus]|uniref:Mediator of RNA polymerase II transcription subunit 4 n=1 Tax=Blyttiomyces helicus TaxID=388810 RepID=A0A4P9W8N7_9FUNG|nr:vitamin-D-receptor interacting mediator subunit 4-domain-containing protein [Blyttiomyces helicus]|eukprot:RKO87825.1 vitamin-D-receptor interacting mediator subunit 4-domain-containing protein [Blyttiomyces helicus]
MPYEPPVDTAAVPPPEKNLADVANSIFPEYLLLSQHLFESFEHLALNRPLGAPGPPPTILRKIVALDAQLQKFIDRLEEHQKYQKRIEQVQIEVEEHNAAILKLVRRLQAVERDLEHVLDGAREKMKIMRTANEGAVDYAELIAYAHRISKHTAAPFVEGSRPMEPPIPQENHMRMSLLFKPDPLKAIVKEEAAVEHQEVDMNIDLLAHTLRPQVHDHAPEEEEELLDLDL